MLDTIAVKVPLLLFDAGTNLAVSYYSNPSAFTSNYSSYIYHLINLKEQNPLF